MSRADNYEPGQAEALYKHHERKRQPYLDEARRCSALTIPWVCPPTSYRRTRTHLPKPDQGLGASGVENLTGKFLNVLLPPGMPFFKVGLSPKVEQEFMADPDRLSQVITGLSQHEMDIVTAIAQDGDRAGLAMGFLHLPIAGNVLLALLPKGGVRHFGLDQYVVTRRNDGKFTRIIVQEATAFSSLHRDHRAQLKGLVKEGPRISDEEIVDVYTHIYRDEDTGRIHEYQEAKGLILEDTDGEWPEDACPWLPLRWATVAGEDYGRGLIELHFKDLERYDEASKALGDAAKNAAKLLWMINGGGGPALAARLSKAKSGDFIVGDRQSVQALQQEKAADLQVAAKDHDRLHQQFLRIFLFGSAVQRGGDRVTKFEVEYLARELEGAYANAYTIIGQEFQEPYFKAKTAQLRKRGVIASLPPKALKVAITTGIDALGRGSDQMRLETLLEGATKAAQVDETLMNPREYMRRSAANLGIKPTGLIPTEEEVMQKRQQEQAQQLMQQVAPEVTRGVSQGALQRQQAALQEQAPAEPSPTPTGEPTT